jgi:hypothetical protein
LAKSVKVVTGSALRAMENHFKLDEVDVNLNLHFKTLIKTFNCLEHKKSAWYNFLNL